MRLVSGTGLIGSLLLVGCSDPSVEEAAESLDDTPIEVSVIPEPRRGRPDSPIRPETYRYLAAIGELESQILDLQDELDSHQDLHQEYEFDSFLKMDAQTIGKDGLFYLEHFCLNGYFTIEREILVRLMVKQLERKASDAAIAAAGSGTLDERISRAMLEREQRMVDIESVLELYRSRDISAEIEVPNFVEPADLASKRDTVVALLEGEREKVNALDGQISLLQKRRDDN